MDLRGTFVGLCGTSVGLSGTFVGGSADDRGPPCWLSITGGINKWKHKRKNSGPEVFFSFCQIVVKSKGHPEP